MPRFREWLVRAAGAGYGALVCAYPAEFRRRFGCEMKQVFRDRLREVLARDSVWGVAWFAMRIACDLAVNIVRERIIATSMVGVLCVVAGLCFGFYGAYVDHHNATEVYPVLLVSLVGSFVLGALRPSHPWRWALIVALCIPFSPFGATMLRVRILTPGSWAIFGVVLIPGMIGAYTGSILRRAARALQ